MVGIYNRIDLIYQHTNTTYKDKNIFYNPNELNKRFSSNVSRYKLSLGNIPYDPYSLDLDTYIELFKSIDITDIIYGELNNNTEHSELLIENLILEENRNNKLILVEPSNISDHLESGDLTPAGLLSIRFNRSYGNKEFKEFIESEFLSEYFYFNEDLNTYIVKESYLNRYGLSIKDIISYINITKSINKQPISPYTFIWRD
jgi:hypothetical protein